MKLDKGVALRKFVLRDSRARMDHTLFNQMSSIEEISSSNASVVSNETMEMVPQTQTTNQTNLDLDYPAVGGDEQTEDENILAQVEKQKLMIDLENSFRPMRC